MLRTYAGTTPSLPFAERHVLPERDQVKNSSDYLLELSCVTTELVAEWLDQSNVEHDDCVA